MEHFQSVCKSLNVDSGSHDWIFKVEAQYSETNRYYHNLQMLDKKMELIEELCVKSNAIILASIFQYFHFDAKRDKREENCDEFKLFVDQVGIKDVSR
jgi:predicted metal-dependent HD superfamily phosphohydrolase